MQEDFDRRAFNISLSISCKRFQSEAHNVTNRLHCIISLENEELLLKEYQKQLTDMAVLPENDVVSVNHISPTSRFRPSIKCEDYREYFDRRPPPSITSFSLQPAPVWKIRRDILRSIVNIISDIEHSRRWLVEDRWDSLREFMFMSSKAHSSMVVIETLQKLPAPIKIVICHYLYF
jgi:hypothetical protein